MTATLPAKLRNGDVVHVEAAVEMDAGDAITLVVRGARGVDQTVRVLRSSLKHYEPGPIRAGDKVLKKIKSGRIEGEVVYRLGTDAWVRWGEDTHTVEQVEGLTRY
jgi:hypothetical protein